MEWMAFRIDSSCKTDVNSLKDKAKAANGVELVRVPEWETLPWLWHGFSTRVGGVSTAYADLGGQPELNLGFTAEDARENVERNRELLAEAVTGEAKTPIATVRQIHSNTVTVAVEAVAGGICEGDGLITDRPGLLMGVLTADCIPVLVADERRKVVAAFHAGWRGTVKRIVEGGTERMRLEFGSRPEDLIAAIGPGIGPCCYAVGEELLSEFSSQFSYAPELFHEAGAALHLDVAEANRRQLLDAGVQAANIKMVGGCTKCQPKLFFSHRGGNGLAGRMLSVIGIKA